MMSVEVASQFQAETPEGYSPNNWVSHYQYNKESL